MGCCENKNNLIQNKNNDLPDSFYFKGIKNEVNLRNNDNINLNSNDKKSINSFLNNKQTSKIDLDKYHKFKILDKINEVESEYNESSVNTRLLSKDIISPQNKIKAINNLIQNNFGNNRFNKIKNLRKNRTLPKFKTILSEENFNKKLSEYSENNNKINRINLNYNFSLKKLNRSKSVTKCNIVYTKAMEDLNCIDNIFNINSEINRKKIKRNEKYKIFNK
jgi:hypothetical protein